MWYTMCAYECIYVSTAELSARLTISSHEHRSLACRRRGKSSSSSSSRMVEATRISRAYWRTRHLPWAQPECWDSEG